MLIAIDIGNTNIVIGGIQGDAIQFEARIATDRIKTSDQYGVEIKNILGPVRGEALRCGRLHHLLGGAGRSSTRSTPDW